MTGDRKIDKALQRLFDRFMPYAFAGLAIFVVLVFLTVFFIRLYAIYFKP